MTVTPEIAQAINLDEDQQGVLVVEVIGDSPADNAGLQGGQESATIQGQQVPVGGDIIVAWGGETVTQMEGLQALVSAGHPGQQVAVTVLRDGARLDLQVTLAAHPTP